jgi:ApaG protein
MAVWVLEGSALMLRHPSIASVTGTALNRNLFKLPIRQYTAMMAANNNEASMPGMDSDERKELWRTISSLERQAVQALASMKSTDSNTEEDKAQLRNVTRFFAQSTGMKQTDPYVQLASRYALAAAAKDVTECERLLQQMSSVGVPPHISSLAKQLAQGVSQGNEGEGELVEGDVLQPEEVDAGSTFSDTVTEKIRVKVSSFYDSAKSDPANGKYMFYYNVAIFNEGSEAVQVVARMWEIEKCRGGKEVVRGAGIMSTQPIIPPGDVFNYESVCPLKVFPPKGKRVLGSMSGAYTMCKGNMGQHNFTAKVSKFNLILPESAMT